MVEPEPVRSLANKYRLRNTGWEAAKSGAARESIFCTWVVAMSRSMQNIVSQLKAEENEKIKIVNVSVD